MSGPDFPLFIGRFHPLLVHIPIGFIVLLAVMEALARTKRFKNVNANAGFTYDDTWIRNLPPTSSPPAVVTRPLDSRSASNAARTRPRPRRR